MIVIGHAQLRQIMDAAEAAYPNECCGLLVGQRLPNGTVEVARVHPSANLSPQRDRFEIDPRLWVDLARALGKGPQQVVGLYHSHPDGPAQPSKADLRAAWGEELVWLIVAVTAVGEGAAPQAQGVHVTAHLLDHGGRQFRPLTLRTPDWKPYPVREADDEKGGG
jgi:proteasome lid subunit RPN8/RPN11